MDCESGSTNSWDSHKNLVDKELTTEVRTNREQTQFPQFGLSLNNEGYPVSLEIGKAYRVIQDNEAASHGYIRVIDESGEDYAYTTNRFHLIQLPTAVEKVLLSALQA